MNEIIPWDDNCPVYQLFDVLGKKWTIYIVFLVGQNISSFSGIMKKLPKINSKVLSDRLDDLGENGFICREVSSAKPLKITYTLTKKGKELQERLDGISDWMLQL